MIIPIEYTIVFYAVTYGFDSSEEILILYFNKDYYLLELYDSPGNRISDVFNSIYLELISEEQALQIMLENKDDEEIYNP